MGTKKKVGKQRRDKFYHLAKETGYRSRAAFKLIQLNRKFEFLQRSRVLVDLCAAPGGWLQVAHKFMPVSSVIIGVDLVPIKPIANVITFQEDITTPKCRQTLKKELKTWKVDVVLHDGAPNIGKSWLHDAFEQARLTLTALKLATEFLVRGGWFVTKVFRSKDYHALLWVFNKLFKKVHATKPQASRSESAEIFVVCQSFLAPDKIDPKFLDPAHVFKEVIEAAKPKLNLFKPEKKKKAEGYEEGDYTLYHRLPASEFINSPNHMELLASNNEIVLDTDFIKSHPLTTSEIIECCKDLKVLGRKELKNLLAWRKKLKECMESSLKDEAEKGPDKEAAVEESDEEGEYEKLKKLDEELKLEQLQQLKRKKKKILKEKRKLRDKMNLKMVIKNDTLFENEDPDLFRLSKFKTKEAVEKTAEADVTVLDDDPDKPGENDDEFSDDDAGRKKWISYDRDEKHYELGALKEGQGLELSGDESDSSVENESLQFESSAAEDEDEEEDKDEDEDEQEKNPLLVDLAPEPSDAEKASMWFNKVQMSDESDEDLQLEMIADHIEKKKKASKGLVKEELKGKACSYEVQHPAKEHALGTCLPLIADRHVTFANDVVSETVKKDENSVKIDVEDENVEEDTEDETSSEGSDDEEVTELEPTPKKRKKKLRLDPEGLALGSILIQSRKKKRDIVEAAFNRYTFNDENLPKWFADDERKHYRRNLPVTPDMVAEYKERLKEINARPIKKIAEAKARKKKRAMKRMEKARKKAEALIDSEDMSEKEKAEHIRTIYKKALKAVKKKPSVQLVVAKKGLGKKATRPPGVKGRFKMVDPRMKKDKRKQKMMEKKGRRGGAQRKKT